MFSFCFLYQTIPVILGSIEEELEMLRFHMEWKLLIVVGGMEVVSILGKVSD